MVVAGNLAVHALGGFFCRFSTVQKFCRFCNVSKNKLKGHPNEKDWILHSNDSYNYIIEQLEGNGGIASAYGIKKSSFYNDLSYFHIIEGLSPAI